MGGRGFNGTGPLTALDEQQAEERLRRLEMDVQGRGGSPRTNDEALDSNQMAARAQPEA